MKQLIHDIVNEFGGREAGSVQERQAQLVLKERLDCFCDRTLIQDFDIPAKAKFESLKIFCAVFYICLILFWFNKPAAFIISFINAILFLGHFVTYQNWLDFLYTKKRSANIIGVVEPLEEATSTVIVSGHMDSAREFIWWWRLKQTGIVFTILSGFLIGLFPIYVGIDLAVGVSGNESLMFVAGLAWWVFALASPITITMFNIHGKDVVPGAQDNLSGVTIASAVGKHFSENRLQRTRVKVVSFGSEEIGLRGSEAYAKIFNGELKSEQAVCINLDGIKDADQLTIVKSEPSTFTTYPKDLIVKMEQSFNHYGINYSKLPLTVGGTDAVSMVRQGIPALTIVGLSMDKLDPTYHTRLDLPDCVDIQALEDTKKVLLHFIEAWDVKH